MKAADSTTRLAAIDIGSNSTRLVVAELLPGGQFRVLDEERETTRLARTLGADGRLSEPALETTLQALRRFLKIASGLEAQHLRVIATCAVREAENGAAFCRQVGDQLGVEVEVISAYEEAQYAFLSVKQAFDISERNVAIADIGGGSTELVFASGGFVDEIYPTRLGAVRLAESFAPAGLFGEDYQKLIREIDLQLKQSVPKPPFVPQVLFGTGGTFTNLASMLMAQRGQANTTMGFRVTRADVKHLAERLQTMTLKQRRNVPGLNADRADIIIPGLAIIDRLMRRLKVNTLQVHSGGVRDGLLWSMVHNLQPGGRQELHREEWVRRFAERCGADWEHSRHVGRLARQIHEQLVEPFQLTSEDSELIELAAMMQDVGYLINYDQHHKHSYHLIGNSRLPGIHRRDLELVANIARYHRGAKPKKKHENFRRLGEDEQRRVRHCSAILRVAGGLDRSHSQQIEAVNVAVRNGTACITVQAHGDPEVDLWSARRRAGLFEKVFGTRLLIRATEDESAVEPQSG